MAPATPRIGLLEYEFSVELDEFLEVCVDEHGEDWEAIAADFLDIAAGLDEELLARDNDFFSPGVLEQRWAELCLKKLTQNEDCHGFSEGSTVPLMKEPGHQGTSPAQDALCLDAVPPCRPHQSHSFTGKPFADVQRHLPSTMDLGDEVNALLDELSDDSEDGDFAQMRRAVKSSSTGLVSAKSAPGATPMRKAVCCPAFRSQHGKRTEEVKVCTLMQPRSSSPALEADREDYVSSEPEDWMVETLDEYHSQDDVDALPIRIIKNLLAKSLEGECSSHTWFGATSQWPRLQVLIGTPDFKHRNGELKAVFDVGRLQLVLAEEQVVYDKLCQRKLDKAGNGATDFIRETEQRRQMIGGGFVLHSPSAVVGN